jgi:radical SAM protein with 4Fe4S-binding SPASM domain
MARFMGEMDQAVGAGPGEETPEMLYYTVYGSVNRVKKCARCRAVAYCGTVCQRRDWKIA